MNFLEVPECETTEELENEIENRVENLKAVFDTSDYWGINMEAITESMARAMMKSEKPFSIIDMYFTLLNAERREDFALDVEGPLHQRVLPRDREYGRGDGSATAETDQVVGREFSDSPDHRPS